MIRLEEIQQNEETTICIETTFSKLRIVKNVFILCLVFFITFTAYDCLSMLQSTINHKHGIGVICQATVYGCYCISSLILPKYVIKKFGCKITIVLSMSLYLPYVASNLYPHWSFMVPTAVLNGLSASLLWGAQSQYLSEFAVQYVAHRTDGKNKEKRRESIPESIKTINEKVTSPPEIKFVISDYSEYNEQNVTEEENKYIIQSSLCEGQSENSNLSDYNDKQTVKDSSKTDIRQSSVSNLQKENSNFISSNDPKFKTFSNKNAGEARQKTINNISLQKDIESMTARFFGIHGLAYLSTHMWSNVMSYFILQNDAAHFNSTLNSSCVCGANFCNEKSDCLKHNLQEPTMDNRYLLIGICLALGLVSIVIMALCLDSLGDRKRDVSFSLDFLLATGKQLKKPNQLLLTPISFYIGMVQGFYTGDFNLSFVGCAWGTSHVALVSACYGAACGFASPVSGWLVKLIGRIPIISFAALVNVAAQILLLHWRPSADNPDVFFVLAALWGTTVGILFAQVKAMYGFLFKNNQEAAFGAYHVWYSLGFCLSFAYSNHLCTYVKIYALLSVLVLAFVGYLGVEVRLRLKLKKVLE